MATQEKQASYPEINVVKHSVTTKGSRGLRNLGNTYYMNEIFQCFTEGFSSLRSSLKQLVRKEGGNLQKQVLTFLKLAYNTEGKVIHPVQARYAVKGELPQFAYNIQQNAHEFLMTIFPVLQLPRYQGSVSSGLQCKSCKYQSIKKEVFSCIEVPVPERGVASLENCLERWFSSRRSSRLEVFKLQPT